LNALLVEMDGFESNEGVILIAATNRPDVLDQHCCGRAASTRVVVRGRREGPRRNPSRAHPQKADCRRRGSLDHRARHTGFSGADLESLANEAALWAARQNRKFILMADFEMAKDKVLMGVERQVLDLVRRREEKYRVHEAGHALVAAMTPGADPVHKVTIIPRGMAWA